MSLTLTSISVEKEAQTLMVGFADGLSVAFPLDSFRRACPCVMCRGGHELMGVPIDPEIFLETPQKVRTLRAITPIGTYALQFTWEDGHNTGLYRLETIRGWAEALTALRSAR
jgi:DUF971 family protein